MTTSAWRVLTNEKEGEAEAEEETHDSGCSAREELGTASRSSPFMLPKSVSR